MNIGFSATTKAFYDLDEKAVYIQNGSWSDDVINISEALWLNYHGQPPQGKIRGADNHGMPCWIDAPEPAEQERIAEAVNKRNAMLMTADTEIRQLKIVEEFHALTDEETQKLLLWKKHFVDVYRIEPVNVCSIRWPDVPA
ncbi:tail fiber assembly protein [Pantoea sp. GCM10028869]|uniref:tail fiber assembly protein n=1 Tax=Pantoea sp. GCM10028869 TaxID=3273417 RepID=UPI00360B5849